MNKSSSNPQTPQLNTPQSQPQPEFPPAPQLSLPTQKQPYLTISDMVLKPDTPQQIQEKVRQGKLNQIICKRWKAINMGVVCSYVVEWRNSGMLQFFGNWHSTLLQQIQDIGFPNLISMNTWGNNIQSIQCLTRIHWPNLQKLNLWHNHLTTVKPLRRIHAPNLTWLDLKQNPITDQHRLSQFYNPSKKLTRLQIHLVADCQALVKLEGESGYDISPNSPERYRSRELQLIVNERRFRRDQPLIEDYF